METGSLCAFNVTRSALLSEKVAHLDANLTALQILGHLMHGPGADKQSAVSIDASCIGRIPRFFAFDVLYLDETMHVIAAGAIDPTTDFPVMPSEVRSALLLPEARIATTGTVPGDQIRLCEGAEFNGVIQATSSPAINPPPSPSTPPSPSIPVQTVSFEVVRPAQFVFEPFLNSLVYSPPLASPNAQSTEFFLPSTATLPEPPQPIAPPQSPVPPELPVIPEAAGPPKLTPAPDSTAPAEFTPSPELATSAEPAPPPESSVPPPPAAHQAPPPSFARPGDIARALEKQPAQRRTRAKKKGEKPPTNETEQPRFHEPEPIRFFDPVEAAQSASDDTSLPQEPPPPRTSNYLSPELKAAILRIDEERRRQRAGEKPALPQSEPVTPSSPAPPPQVLSNREPPAPVAPTPIAPLVEVEPPAPDRLIEIPAPSAALASPEPASATPAVPPPLDSEQVFQPPSAPRPEEPEVLEQPVYQVAAVPSLQTPATTPLPAAKPDREFTPIAVPPKAPAPKPETPLASKPKRKQAPKQEAKPEPPLQPAAKLAKSKSKPSIAARLSRWLEGDALPLILDGQRRATRHVVPGLVAFYFTGGTPRPHEILNISTTGFFLRTRDLWSPNTILRMTIQRRDPETETEHSLTILARVVRVETDGVGHEFISKQALQAVHHRDLVPEAGTDIKALKTFLNLQ